MIYDKADGIPIQDKWLNQEIFWYVAERVLYFVEPNGSTCSCGAFYVEYHANVKDYLGQWLNISLLMILSGYEVPSLDQ